MPDPTEEQAAEARAFIGLLGKLHGFDELPMPDSDADPVPLPSIQESIDAIGAAKHLPGPQRLELLARSVRAGRDQPTFDHLDLRGFADSLVDEGVHGLQRESTTATLLEHLAESREGADPLLRTIEDLATPEDFLTNLREDIPPTLLWVHTECKAATTTEAGVPALNIVTECVTRKPLADFRTIVDPREWPNCWLESTFFKRMDPVPPSPPPPPTLTRPDDGWSGLILETVDFGFAFGSGPAGEVQTLLEFVYFFNATPQVPALGPAAGCTYDLKQSMDGKILVDQGYLLVEELRHPTGPYRRYGTQKEVRFLSGTPTPQGVCCFWSVATGLIKQWC